MGGLGTLTSPTDLYPSDLGLISGSGGLIIHLNNRNTNIYLVFLLIRLYSAGVQRETFKIGHNGDEELKWLMGET